MTDYPRIAIINTGWSDDYREDQVRGDFGYLADGVGHERFNFLPDRHGRFYGYAPPLGESWSPPKPENPEGWLVFFVSKRPGRNGLYLVGWYEDALFLRAYEPRPDAERFGPDSDGGKFLYTVTSTAGFLVPLPLRSRKIKGDHLKRSYAYVRGSGEDQSWRTTLARELLRYRDELIPLLAGAAIEDDEPALRFSGDPERRQAVEKAAVKAVEQHFSDYACVSKEAEKCGYDLLLTHRETDEILHVEVKGTSLAAPGFFLTQKELGYAESLRRNDNRARKSKDGSWRPLWRLAVVSDALGTPTVHEYKYTEMTRNFDLAPYAWRGTLKEKS